MISRLERWPYLPRALLIALIAVVLALAFSVSDVFRRVDFTLSDTHSRLFARKVNFDDVAVIDVDEESVSQLQSKLGPWPYDREVYALVVRWLKSVGVRSIGFDILFSEARKGDAILAEALDESVVLPAAALPFSFERDSAYRLQLMQKSWGVTPPSGTYPLTDLTLPRAQLTARAGIGVVSALVDSDGILRRVPLAFSVYGRVVPGMALALSQSAPAQIAVSDGRLAAGGKSWPVSPLAEVVLHYPANLESLRTVPFYQVVLAASGAPGLEPLADTLRAALQGKHVLIGSSSAALGDYLQTPLGRQPGVKVQAMIAQLLMGGHVLKPRSLLWQMTLVVCTLLLVTAMGRRRWQTNTALQWSVFPLVFVFIGFFAAFALERGQAVGLLFAMTAGVLMHLISLLVQQVQLFRRNQRLEMEKRAALQADALKS